MKSVPSPRNVGERQAAAMERIADAVESIAKRMDKMQPDITILRCKGEDIANLLEAGSEYRLSTSAQEAVAIVERDAAETTDE